MKTYAIPSAGLEVSSVVLGLMRIGSMAGADIDRLVRTAIDEGVTVFDHADVYGGDHLCERRFGEAVKLTAAERRIMAQHPVIGERLCGNLRVLQRVRPIVRHHHERLDGSGYPDGLAGDDVPLLAQIIGIVDVYDAITTNRPNHTARSRDEAFEELSREVARGWRRKDLVDAFIAQRRDRPMPWEVDAAPAPKKARRRAKRRR